METTVGGRLRQYRESKSLKGTAFAERAGIKQTTFSAIENGDSVPSYPILQKLLTAYPDLSSDWLLMGEGSMLKSNQSLTPATPPLLAAKTEPAAAGPPLISAAATVDHATELLLRGQMEERIKELTADKARLISENVELRDENKLLLGKPFDSSDAADESEPDAPTPKAPTGQLPSPKLRVQVRGLRRYQD